MNRRQRRAQTKTRAHRARPALPDGQALLAEALRHHRAGRLEKAKRLYGKILKSDPEQPDALHYLGVIADQAGNHEKAVELIERAIAAHPENGEAHNNLGAALKHLGRVEEGAAAYAKAIELWPDYAEAHNNLGNTLRELGKLEEAVASITRSLALKPGNHIAHNNLGNALKDCGRFEDAILAFKRAISLNPRYAKAYSNLSNTFRDLGKLEEAIALLSEAIALDPNTPDYYSNLGNAFLDRGNIPRATECYGKALELKPDHPVWHSNLLFGMNYNSAFSAADVWVEAQRWDRMHGKPTEAFPGPYANESNPDRRLKVGYVSPDFRTHSVAYFFEPLVEAHDPNAVEVFCYAEVPGPDETTERLKALADHWRSTVGLGDARVAEQIRSDGIDILVDLAGHTADNRLQVFALKPAPVQVTWLGFPNTTGMEAMGYRLTDDIADPPGDSDQYSSERLVRLPQGFHCYCPPADAPDVAALPLHAAGHVTFGSFNNLTKVSAELIDTWAQVLHQTPGSRLLIKSHQLADAKTREHYLKMFAVTGIETDRLEFAERTVTTREHLDLYSRIDVALDTFPYNGTTTTCEALWMGAPVVTLAGNRHAGRVGASLLTHVGLADLIAESVESYVAKAVALADHPDRMAGLRARMRRDMAASPLCDRDGFARDIEAAYRGMWRRWCEAHT